MANPNNKYVQFGAGWLKNQKDGSQYISAVGGDTKNGLKLLLQNANGDILEVSSFAVFFNKNKKKPEHPDVRFTVTVGE